MPYSQDYELVPKFGVIKEPRQLVVNPLDLLPEVAEYMDQYNLKMGEQSSMQSDHKILETFRKFSARLEEEKK